MHLIKRGWCHSLFWVGMEQVTSEYPRGWSDIMSPFGLDDVVSYLGMMMSWLTLISAGHVLIFWYDVMVYFYHPEFFSIVSNHIKKRSHSKRIIHELQVWVMAFNQLTTMEEFEICIWRNEFPCDLILDRMVALRIPEEVSCLCIYLVRIYFAHGVIFTWPTVILFLLQILDSSEISAKIWSLGMIGRKSLNKRYVLSPLFYAGCKTVMSNFSEWTFEKLLTKILFFCRVELAGKEQPR